MYVGQPSFTDKKRQAPSVRFGHVRYQPFAFIYGNVGIVFEFFRYDFVIFNTNRGVNGF